MTDVLVLNRNFSAIRIIQAKEAFTLLFRGAAEVIMTEDDSMSPYSIDSWLELSEMRELFDDDGRWIKTPSRKIRVPSIIRLLDFARLPYMRIRLNRRNVMARDQKKCQYCGQEFASKDLTFDHVIPVSRGGQTSWTNIVCACLRCNQRKGDRTPQEAGMPLIKKPVKPRRNPAEKNRLLRDTPKGWRYFVDEAYWGVKLD